MRKLKYNEVATVRAELLAKQGGKCALCGLLIKPGDEVLDHDHGSGHIRATLHRGCNSLLGKVENNHKRYGVASLPAFLNGAAGYLWKHALPATDMLHPTFKTEEEKKAARREKARASRALRAQQKKGTA